MCQIQAFRYFWPAGSPLPVDWRKRSFNSAIRCAVVLVMAVLLVAVGRLIATCKKENRPAEAGNCKSRASKTQEKRREHRRNFDCFFCF
jgi:hypothetical protein